MGLLTQASVAIDGSKFKAVNNRDRNFTRAKMERRMAQIEESVARYLQQLDTADRHQLPHRLVAVVAEVPPKAAAPTPGLRSESLPCSAAGMNPSWSSKS